MFKYALILSILFLIFGSISIAQPVLREGWPQNLRDLDGFYAIMDNISYTKDAQGRILIAASCRTRVGVWDLEQNSMLPGFPIDFSPAPPSPVVVAGPYLVDMTGDGDPEVYVCARRFGGEGEPRMILRFWLDGTQDHQFTRLHDPEYTNMSALCFADVTFDGNPELFYSSDSIHAVDAFGNELPGFPWESNGYRESMYRGNLVVALPPIAESPTVFWPTVGLIHSRRIEENTERTGWPVSFRSVNQEISTIVIIPEDQDYLLAISGRDSVHVWNNSGSLIEGFPMPTFNPDRTLGPYFLSVGQVDGDERPDLIYTMMNEHLDAVNLSGERLLGYPLEADFNNYSDVISILREDMPGSSALVFQPKCSTDDVVGSYQIHAFLNTQEVPGFPIEGENNPSLGSFSSLALIPSENFQTLHIVYNTNMGMVVVYDWSIDLRNYISEWNLPGNNNYANRIYDPQRFTPNSPPNIAFREPADSVMEIEIAQNQLFRIEASDPDTHPIEYFFKLDNQIIGFDSLFSHSFSDTGRFVVTGFAADHHAAMDSVTWEIFVSSTNPVKESGEEIDPEESGSVEFFAYPNPTNGALQIQYSLPKSMDVRIKITNLLGQTLFSENIGSVSIGRHEHSVFGNDLPSGNYIVQLIYSTSVIKQQKITIVR
ncbi:T9SS type A sorting domain-containing protein [bacterium]|nr:T9SS type A sorting domain-containing protein [bacterium]